MKPEEMRLMRHSNLWRDRAEPPMHEADRNVLYAELVVWRDVAMQMMDEREEARLGDEA